MRLLKNKGKVLGFTILGFFALVGLGFAQTDEERIAQLREQIAELEKQAEKFRSGIAQEQAEARTLKNEIAALEAQIKNLQLQISLTGKKIDRTKIEINGVSDTIYNTQEDIASQQRTIGQLILFLDRRDQENLLEVLLKNKNLSDFFRTGQYTANVSEKLLALVGDLKRKKDELEGHKNTLEGKKYELEDLNRQQLSKQTSLAGTKTGKNTLLAQTKGQEAQYQKMLNEVERKKANFFSELRQLESDIILGGTWLVEFTASKLPPRGTKLFSWPEDDFRITQGYGMTTYARRGAYGGAPHNGIDLASGFGTPIKSIGDGEIVANGSNKGYGNWVAIRHQYDLVSVYGHMSALSPLRVGTKVKMGDVIGYEGATGNATGSHLHLSLYKRFFTYLKGDELYFNYFDGSINPDDYI